MATTATKKNPPAFTRRRRRAKGKAERTLRYDKQQPTQRWRIVCAHPPTAPRATVKQGGWTSRCRSDEKLRRREGRRGRVEVCVSERV